MRLKRVTIYYEVYLNSFEIMYQLLGPLILKEYLVICGFVSHQEIIS